MGIAGIQQFEFGVQDIATCTRFLTDFGLSPLGEGGFEALNGSVVQLHGMAHRGLPAAFESGPTLRRITWAVTTAAELERLAHTLADAPGFHCDDDGVHCIDPNGLGLRFQRSTLREPELPPAPAMNQWGDARRVDQPSPVYDQARPIGIGHAVLFVDDLEAAERFYCDLLGFHVSDRYVGRGVFLRVQARAGHHNLFLLKLPGRRCGLNHVAFIVRDIHEVFGGGLQMSRRGWETFLGPGRHPISSAYFWYVNSPTGGAFEYYTNEDHLTGQWMPRELEHSVASFTEWAVEGGIDADTRRQAAARPRP